MKNLIDNLKNIEIEIKDGREFSVKGIRIFDRFPNFSPFVGDKYGSDESKKLLLIWESYYTTKSALPILKSSERWYFDSQNDEVQKLFGNKTNDYERHWNFASKMHEEGVDRKSPTFQNIEKVLDKYSKEKKSFKYCAGYNYYLRPALKASSIRSDKLDEKVAAETLKAVIKELNPNTVIFFSKKANASFKPHREEFENVKFKAFVHPASPWWNRKSGKEQKSGKERFEEFIEKLHQ